MGKSKITAPLDADFTFTPEISTNSRKLALQNIYGTKLTDSYNSEVVTPRFMQFTIARRESVELGPLKNVPHSKAKSQSLPIAHLSSKDKLTNQPGTIKPPHHQRTLGPLIHKKKSFESLEEAPVGVTESTTTTTNKTAKKNSWFKDGLTQDLIRLAAGKQSLNMSLPEYNAEQFTFRPKVSVQSTKIAESLGTDFMSRQQQHLEKQRKHVRKNLFVAFFSLFCNSAKLHL